MNTTPASTTSATLRIGRVNLWVFDQQAALDFYVNSLGFEVSSDTDLGFMRWLTVHPAGQPDVEFILCDPSAVMPQEKAEVIRSLLAEGLGGGPQLLTKDCRETVAELRTRGVEFTQEPTDRGYFVDAELKDPDGNRLRIIELAVPTNTAE